MKTAVVIIHGIGEQRPMDTLRGFVEAVVEPQPDQPKYFSKPDEMSDLFDLRRLHTFGRSGVDFYEYYWAHHMPGEGLIALGAWMLGLIVRSGKDVPPSIKALWLCGRFLVVLLLLTLVGGGLTRVAGIKAAVTAFSIAWILLVIATASVQSFLV